MECTANALANSRRIHNGGLSNLRQDAGFLPLQLEAYRMLPHIRMYSLIFTSTPFINRRTDCHCPFYETYRYHVHLLWIFSSKGAMTAHMLYILERFFESGLLL
jgi:hypothetical protein